MLNDITYDLPNGPGNLATLFPAIEWKLVDEYYLELYDGSNSIVLTTPTNKVSKEWVAPSFIRLHFLNYLGRYDSISYHLYTRNNEVKSTSWLKGLPLIFEKPDGGLQRTGVRARITYVAKHSFYDEKSHLWLEELLESPLAYKELQSIDGQPMDYVPVVITDKNTVTKKEEGRYVYETTFEFTLANEKVGLTI